jgi:hypothetical protein
LNNTADKTKSSQFYGEVMISNALQEFEQVEKSYSQIKSEVRDFLKHYYDEVGHLYEVLSCLKAEATKANPPSAYGEPYPVTAKGLKEYREFSKKRQIKESHIVNAARNTNERWKKELKSTYRTLAKNLHPDINGNRNKLNIIMFHKVKEAYKNNDLGRLKQLELQTGGQHHMPVDNIGFKNMARQYDSIIYATRQLKQKQEELLASAEYMLMQRAFQLKLCGDDLINIIKRDLLAQISNIRNAETQDAPASGGQTVLIY